MNVVVVLNERPAGSHPDIYEAFDALVAEGVIADRVVCPYLLRRDAGAADDEIGHEILTLAREGEADLIVWMHTRDLAVSPSVVEELRGLPSAPVMLYWEGDSYHPVYKPLPAAMLHIMAKCDTVFLPCGGPIVATLEAAGCSDVRYAPSCASASRFPPVWRPSPSFDWDVVMIGNKVHSLRPGRTMPGARRRARLVRVLSRRYGSRFAVFGAGWRGKSAMGSCRFDEQSDLYRRSTATVGVNNSTYPYVFSNRLPIALASGIPLAYSRNPGFSEVFGPELDELFFGDAGEAVRRLDALVDGDADVLAADAVRRRAFFERNLSRAVVCSYVVAHGAGVRSARNGRGSLPAELPPAAPPPAWQSIRLGGAALSR